MKISYSMDKNLKEKTLISIKEEPDLALYPNVDEEIEDLIEIKKEEFDEYPSDEEEFEDFKEKIEPKKEVQFQKDEKLSPIRDICNQDENTSLKSPAIVPQKKWKNIRDHYRKECARRKTEKSGSGASSAKKEYIYYSQLSFLSSTVETRPQKSSDKVEEDTDVQTARSECSQDLPKIQAKKKKVSHEDSLIGALSANFSKQIQEPKEDADKDFLMSLLPYVKSVPDSAKLDCRCEILQVLKKYNTSSFNPMQYAPYPNSHVNYQNFQTPIQNSQPVLGHCRL